MRQKRHPDPYPSALSIVVVFLLMLGQLACERQPESANEEPAVETAAAQPPSSPSAASDEAEAELDVLARFLAGLEPLPELLAPEPWAVHAEAMARLWGELEKRRLDRMRSWAAEELDPRDPRATLVYPFGGPDFLTAEHFFPQAASTILIGLEPPGEILIGARGAAASQEVPANRGAALAAALGRVRGGFESLLESGYFVTKKMEQDLAGDDLNGVLPMLMIFLARTEKTIIGASYVALDDAGTAYDVQPESAASASAVRIDFVDQAGGSEGAPRSLYFFSQDLSNAGLDGTPFDRFLAGLGRVNVYMKSTQYLPHLDDFSVLSARLLDQGQTILQDDSGIPLRLFQEADRQIRYFGTYTRTLPAYREYFQEDLRQAFASRPDLPPLDFALGYHTRIGGSCLIWAERRGDGPS